MDYFDFVFSLYIHEKENEGGKKTHLTGKAIKTKLCANDAYMSQSLNNGSSIAPERMLTAPLVSPLREAWRIRQG